MWLPCYTLLIDSDYCIIMYLSCCLNETNNNCCVTQVSQTASDVICHILDGQLLMTEDLWKEVLNALMRSLPVLEVGSLSQISLEEMIGSIMISRHKLASFSVFEYMYSYYRNNMMKHCRHMLIWGQSLDPPSCHWLILQRSRPRED